MMLTVKGISGIITLRKILFILLFAAFFYSNGLAQPVTSPEINCVSVIPTSGNAVLTWTAPPDLGSTFVSYKIYSSLIVTGPYALIATINTYTQTTYTHVGANANAARVYYLIQTESSGSVISAPRDTFSTIFLNVVNPGNGTAQLSWNNIALHPVSKPGSIYKIYREYPTGIWTLHDSTKKLTYTDIVDVCKAILKFRVEIADDTGCSSVSNVAGGNVFGDQTPPVLSTVDTVSVNKNSGKATISWLVSPSLDAIAYIIYQQNNPPTGAWLPIDTVYGRNSTFYENPSSSAGTTSEFYRIAVMDSCGNISPQGTIYRTIYLSSTVDICASIAKLTWNKYINISPAISQYKIYKSINAGPFSLLITLSASDTTYTDNTIALGNSYCYIIQASNGAKASSSNKICFKASIDQPPQFTYNRVASVLGDRSIKILAHVDPAKSVYAYRLQRATANAKSFSTLVTLAKPTNNLLSYIDNSVNTTSTSYLYKIDVIDSCNHVITTSNTNQTILLEASVAINVNIDLVWNDYSNWLGRTSHYEIYRAVDGVWGASPIATVAYSGQGGVYTDNVSPFFTTSKGAFYYKVMAVEGGGNKFGFKDTSFSNIAKLYEYPKYYIPNTFTPNGDNLNDIFRPIIGFIDPSDYTLTIFDNTGTPVFTTNSPLEGWDGKKEGHHCQEGVYIYLILCKASNGDSSKISGTLSLIH